MNKLDLDYQNLLKDILENGVVKKDRTGTGTISVFGRTIRHDMSEGFPLLTTKKMAWRQIVTELLWFLSGSTNIQSLVKDGNTIWIGDCYKIYENSDCAIEWLFNKAGKEECENDDFYRHLSKKEFIERIKTDDAFAKQWGDIGPGYGKQWRNWGGIDQIQNLIDDLQDNPDSRRLMVNAWNVDEVNKTILPPCHYGFQCWTRETTRKEKIKWMINNKPDIISKNWPLSDSNMLTEDEINNSYGFIPQRTITLQWNQRSCDFPLGIPFNIASYGLLLIMLADEVNMIPGELIGIFGDSHIYLNQIDGVKEQIGEKLSPRKRTILAAELGIGLPPGTRSSKEWDLLCDVHNVPKRTREPLPLPNVTVLDGMYCSSPNDVILENYKSHPIIKFPLSN